MLLLKFWYFFCLIVLIENLKFLFKLSENEKYKAVNLKLNFKTVICFHLDRVLEKKTKNESVIISELISKVYDKLENHFNEKKAKFLKNFVQNSNATFQKVSDELNLNFFVSKNVLDKSIKEIKKDLENYFGDSFKNLIKKEESYIVNDFVCFLNEEIFLNYLEIFNEFIYKMFSYSVKPAFEANLLIFDHKYKSHSGLKVLYIVVKKCLGQVHSSSNFSPYECLNDCLIKKDRKSNYMFKIKEEQRLILKDEIRDIDHEKHCYEKCSKKHCYFGSFETVNIRSSIKKEILNSEIYSDSSIDFWIQFISLIFLFLNITFNSLINNLIKLLFKVIKKEKSIATFIV